MSANQFYVFLFGLSLFGGLSFVLLVEVCKLRNLAYSLLDIANKHRRQIHELQGDEEHASARIDHWSRQIEDLQAVTSIQTAILGQISTNVVNMSERLKLVESSHFFLVRKPPEVVGEPGEVHPFAVDALVTVSPDAAAA